MKKSDNIQELEYLASSQWGMFTTAQAAALGVGRTQISRMVKAGTIELVRRGTYHYTVGEETSHLYIKAAWLSCYPKLTAAERLRRRPHDAVLACATAASLHGIGDLHENPYTFIVRRRRQTSLSDLSFHLWELDERDVTFVDTLPVTTIERTIADLVREQHDPDHIAQAVRDSGPKSVDVLRLQQLLDSLGPAYNEVITYLQPTIDEPRAADEAMLEAMVNDIVAALDKLKEASKDSAALEEDYTSIVRRRLTPIIQTRLSEMGICQRADNDQLDI